MFIWHLQTSNHLSYVPMCHIFRLQETPIVAASGSTANLVQLLTHLIIFVHIFPLYFGKLNLLKCTLQVPITGLLFTLLFSVLFTKIQKPLSSSKSTWSDYFESGRRFCLIDTYCWSIAFELNNLLSIHTICENGGVRARKFGSKRNLYQWVFLSH